MLKSDPSQGSESIVDTLLCSKSIKERATDELFDTVRGLMLQSIPY
jgi:hypothetical protein